MNIDRLEILAQHLEQPESPYHFDLATWLKLRGNEDNDWCGTVCCIAGLTVLLFSYPDDDGEPIRQPAQDLLNLNREQADNLFVPDVLSYKHLTRADAARAVRRLMAGHPDPWVFT